MKKQGSKVLAEMSRRALIKRAGTGAMVSPFVADLLNGVAPAFAGQPTSPRQGPDEVEMYFSPEEYRQRWDKVYALMEERELDAAIFWSRTAGSYDACANVLYLTNFYSNHSGQLPGGPGHSAAILVNGNKPLLIADEAPVSNMIATDDYIAADSTFVAAAEALEARGIGGKVALVGSDVLPMEGWLELERSTSGIEWVPETSYSSLIAPVRRIKSPREIEACRRAGETCSRALTAQIQGMLDGMSESEAAGEAAREMYRAGGQPHRILIAHGKYTESIVSEHVQGFSNITPKDGDLIRCWVYGPSFQGYWMDPGRTTVKGKPSEGQKDLVETTAGVVDALVAAIKPGKKILDVVAVGDKLVEDFDGDVSEMGKKWQIFGHGNGLFFEGPSFPSLAAIRRYEPHRLDEVVEALANETLEENMVMGVEVFLGRDGVGQSGFETNIVITAEGAEVITPTPMIWW